MKIMFTGDINLAGLESAVHSCADKILSDVMPYIKKADFVIPNLECPLADKEKYKPIKKDGPNLICGRDNIKFLKAMKAYAVTLANNHIGDYGDGALFDTLDLLKENNIAYTGAGKDVFEAYEALQIECGGTTVSVLSVCENEFGIAEEEKAGSAGYNPRRLMNKIKEEKMRSDFVVVVFHGGNEFNPLPSPDTAERYRFICDMGADAVVGGHTHCPQGFEVYDKKPIIYSMGNFLFKRVFEAGGEADKKDPWYYGYFTLLDITEEGISFELVPFKFDIPGTKITVFDGKNKEEMMGYIKALSKIIENPLELKRYFKGWAFDNTAVPQMPENINNLSEYNSAANYNLLKCEAHLSKTKQIFEILFCDEVKEAKKAACKLSELKKMPV